MKNLLLAVDFSQTSISAFFYAAKLASELNARLNVLHSIVPVVTDTGVVSPTYSVQNELAGERLQYFLNEIPKQKNFDVPDIEIVTHLINGPAVLAISTFAQENQIDMIIMGTIEKTNIFGRMIGSVTKSTINNVKCPVLLIHKNTRYTKPQRIVFGIDKKGDLDEALERFNEVNNKLKTYTEFVHIKADKSASLTSVKNEIITELVEKETAKYSFEIKAIDGDNPAHDIIDYCIFSKADMLVMIHHERNYFQRVYSGSLSISAAENIHLPILIIPSK